MNTPLHSPRPAADRKSIFGTVEPYAGDPIFGLLDSFRADPRQDKINLAIGVYTDGDGRIPALESVRSAREKIGWGPRPYLPMEGHAAYRSAVQRIVFGEQNAAVAENRVATIQTIGATGAIGIAADFLAKHCPDRTVYVSDPTWDNHHGLFQRAGFETARYPYWDANTRSIPFDRLLDTLDNAAPGAIVVIQPACHNPTGLDLSRAQEAELTALMIRKRHIAVFDVAYQGFGSGLAEDVAFVRRYADKAACLVAYSFSKNFALYGERCGALNVVCHDVGEARRVLGQLVLAVRRSYSAPPTTGALLVAEVLNDPLLFRQWSEELTRMRQRLDTMCAALAQAIGAVSKDMDVGFLGQQRGMFRYPALSNAQIEAMRARDGVYLADGGRLCLAALMPEHVETVARSLVAEAEGALDRRNV